MSQKTLLTKLHIIFFKGDAIVALFFEQNQPKNKKYERKKFNLYQ